MSDLNTSLQFANIPLPSDLPFYNYGSSAIGVGLVVSADTSNTMDGTIGNDGPGVVVCPVSGNALPLGVTMEIVNGTNLNSAGANAGRVRVTGTAVCTAAGTITAGTAVTSQGSGTAGQVIAAASHVPYVGIALTSAVSGDPILVLVAPGGYSFT